MNKVYNIHTTLIKTGHGNDPFVLRRLLLQSASAASASPQALPYTRTLFALIPSPDTVTYNTIIRAHAPHSPSHALSYFTHMLLHNTNFTAPDHYTFPFVLKASARLHTGKHLHSMILKLGFDQDVYVQNGLVSFYGGLGNLGGAWKAFEEMRDRDAVSWGAMIGCLVNNGFAYEALEVFRDMQVDGSVKVDEVVVLSVASAVSSLGVLELAYWVYGFVWRSGLGVSLRLGTALIDMFSRCGGIDMGIRVFDEMRVRNVLTWSVLITGLAVHGRSREALRIFEEMRRARVRPDCLTITGVLVACSHGGLVDEGWRAFESVRSEYGMEPLLEHYGCMVDLLGRVGFLKEAFEFVGRMPLRPNSIIWRTLLGACVNHNNLELAEKAKERLREIDPYHDGDYVLLSNAYGAVGRWAEKARVRNLMRGKGIGKKPGYSLINDQQVIHEFVSGDSSHPQSDKIRKFLVSVIESLRVEGYTPYTHSVLHDIEEEEKEHSLSFHSEKLAVAYALLNSSDRRTIRIMKNLRTCHDCHSFMKYVSGKFDKDIIVRDQNRFHHFRKGSCSCNGFW